MGARAHYFRYVLDEQGNAIEGATISVYEAGTTTPAKIYTSEDATQHVSSVTTGSDGSFEFWVDSDDYDPLTQEFKIVATKAGLVSKTFDYVNVFPLMPHSHEGGGTEKEFSDPFTEEHTSIGAPWVHLDYCSFTKGVVTFSNDEDKWKIAAGYVNVMELQSGTGDRRGVVSFYSDIKCSCKTPWAVPFMFTGVFEGSDDIFSIALEGIFTSRGTGTVYLNNFYMEHAVHDCGNNSMGYFGVLQCAVKNEVASKYTQYGFCVQNAPNLHNWPDEGSTENASSDFVASEGFCVPWGKFRRGFSLGHDEGPKQGAGSTIYFAAVDLCDAGYDSDAVGIALPSNKAPGAKIVWMEKTGSSGDIKAKIYYENGELYAVKEGGTPKQLT